MEENAVKKFFKDRFNILIIAILIIVGIIIYRLVDLQIIHGDEYYEKSQYKLMLERRIMPARGNILDRNGVPIAVNRVGYN
ncbi:MAG: penicillin-binding protein 2, partial [Clostridiaceae bacterium]|nr:penicillin-binding protein 2 [Clostridiaceae bacterium]